MPERNTSPLVASQTALFMLGLFWDRCNIGNLTIHPMPFPPQAPPVCHPRPLPPSGEDTGGAVAGFLVSIGRGQEPGE